MNKYFIIIVLLLLVMAAVFLAAKPNKNATVNNNTPADQSPQNSETKNIPAAPENILNIPLEKAIERITKKPFGIFITPQNSPVQPERFSGYHTGTDFEILSGEENQEVAVFAICEGKIIYRNTVNGYGGVLIQRCILNGETVTILYGHISLDKSPARINAEVKKGDQIAILGQGFSAETSGERKHLHLGIHKGAQIDLRGYVQSQNELSGWMDFEEVFGLK